MTRARTKARENGKGKAERANGRVRKGVRGRTRDMVKGKVQDDGQGTY